MKAESLNALLIDRELGELTPEAVELLESWLAEHPDEIQGADKLHETVRIARETLGHFPELGWPAPRVLSFGRSSPPLVPLALAASVVILIGTSSWLGFKAGRESREAQLPIQRESPAISKESLRESSPWAQYALASNPEGGLTIVRNDKHN